VGSAVKVSFARDNTADAAAQIARTSDVAIVIVGNHPTCNAGWAKCPLPSDGKEAIDRKSITLEQEELVKQVLAVNPRTVVVLISSFPFAISWTEEHAPAIVHMAHNSQEEGNALADVLFGDYNPAGRLVVTWPMSLDQLPSMMDYDIRHGRTYMYFRQKQLYPVWLWPELHNIHLFQSADEFRAAETRRRDHCGCQCSEYRIARGRGSCADVRGTRELDGGPADRRTEGIQTHRATARRDKNHTRASESQRLGILEFAKGGFEVEPDHVSVRIGSSFGGH